MQERESMQVKKDFILREIAGDYIIIPTEKTAIEFNGLITVNEVGVFLWRLLQNNISQEDLLKSVLEEYDVEEEVAKEDIQEFLDVLVKGGILVSEHTKR